MGRLQGRRRRPDAAGGARGLGATIEEVSHGLTDFRPDADRSPGRLNLFRLGDKVIIVDFAHNEAGIAAVLCCPSSNRLAILRRF